MLFFPSAKINLGLNVIRKRKDGYHDIETVMYPIGLCDAMEFIVDRQITQHKMTYSGEKIIGEHELCAGLLDRLSRDTGIPPLHVHLHKNIPPGAGLGGGSADALFFLMKLIEYFNLPLDFDTQYQIAKETGSDCPFFLYNKPLLATGRGEVLSEIKVSLKGYNLLLVIPGIDISTQEAYAAVIPSGNENLVASNCMRPVVEWKDILVNQFEEILFPKYPLLGQLKNTLYSMGALYASVTGSGSGIYGIFKEQVKIPQELKEYRVYIEKMN